MPHTRVDKHVSYTSQNGWHGGRDYFADSFIGAVIYQIFKPKWYAEEQDDYVLPDRYRRDQEKPKQPHRESSTSSADTLVAQPSEPSYGQQGNLGSENQQPDVENQRQGKEGKEKKEEKKEDNPEDDPNIVTWYSEHDPANPQNWSITKKCIFTAQLSILTFSIYIGSAIYSVGYGSLIPEFGITQTVATLGLTLFVFGYAIGPLFLSAPSDIPQIGRQPIYMITLAIFVILQVPSALTNSFAGLMVLRFLAGFIGSPVLATGGASLGDIFTPKTRPYAMGIWGLAAVGGPVLGPLIGGFAVMANDWRWAFWILLWLDGGCLLVLIFTMPESSSATILTRRAQRLRKLTGNQDLRSQGEIASKNMAVKQIAYMSVVRPFVLIFTEPMCLACHLYVGLVYSILYAFIESFALVFEEMYGFNLGENGLAYLGLMVGTAMAYVGFCIYNWKVTIPKMRKSKGGELAPEERLPIAIVGSFLLPICLFMFGWTANPSIHFMVPIISTCFFGAGALLLFLSVLNYLGDSYPTDAAAVYAGNDFVRSMMGGAFPLFSLQLFRNLGHGVAWGSTLLGCLTVLFLPIPIVLYLKGKTLRMNSKNARHDI